MRKFVNLSIILGVLVVSTSNSTSSVRLKEHPEAEYLLMSIDAITSATIPTKNISWQIGSTQGTIRGWVDSNGVTLLEEKIKDGPGILVVKYFIVNEDIVMMHRRYAQQENNDEQVHVINDQYQFYREKSLCKFLKSSFESEDLAVRNQLGSYSEVPVREDNFSYQFTSKSCHALLLRFRHEHIFDIISNVEFQQASYHLN